MRAVRIPLLVLAVSLAVIGCFLPSDAWYDLIIENQTSGQVEVVLDGPGGREDRYAVEPCSEHTNTAIWFQPGRPVGVRVRDLEDRLLVETQQVPEREKTTRNFRTVVVVPGSKQGECPQIRVIPTPTPSSPMDKNKW